MAEVWQIAIHAAWFAPLAIVLMFVLVKYLVRPVRERRSRQSGTVEDAIKTTSRNTYERMFKIVRRRVLAYLGYVIFILCLGCWSVSRLDVVFFPYLAIYSTGLALGIVLGPGSWLPLIAERVPRFVGVAHCPHCGQRVWNPLRAIVAVVTQARCPHCRESLTNRYCKQYFSLCDRFDSSWPNGFDEFRTVRALCKGCGWFRVLGYTGVKQKTRALIRIARDDHEHNLLKGRVKEVPYDAVEADWPLGFHDLNLLAHASGHYKAQEAFHSLLDDRPCPRCKQSGSLCVNWFLMMGGDPLAYNRRLRG